MREDRVVGAALAGRPTCEDRQEYTAEPASHQTLDPIRGLIKRLEAATASGGSVTLNGRAIRVRVISGGFALERRP
jgi:hypothetical protein